MSRLTSSTELYFYFSNWICSSNNFYKVLIMYNSICEDLYTKYPLLTIEKFVFVILKTRVNFIMFALPVAERFCTQNRKTGGFRFNPWSRLLTLPFGVFRSFLRNLCKYGLGSLRKTSHGGCSTYSPRSHKRTIGLKTCNQLRKKYP